MQCLCRVTQFPSKKLCTSLQTHVEVERFQDSRALRFYKCRSTSDLKLIVSLYVNFQQCDINLSMFSECKITLNFYSTTQPQPPPRETAPPTIDTAPAPTPATISFQRLELKKTPAPTPTSTVQRPPTPPVKAKKQTRRTAPLLTSSPIAVQPEQMTTLVDLNVAISDTSSSDLPEIDELEADKQLTQAKLDKYKFRKLIKHYVTDYSQCRFIQAQRKRRRPDTTDIGCILRQIRRGALLPF